MVHTLASLETVFLDAAGTLFELTESVGHGYARIARRHHFQLDPARTDRAFRAVWKRTPSPNYISACTFSEREAIDRRWWRHLVEEVMIETGTNPGEQLDAYFDELYLHYGQGEAWKPFPGTQEALATLAKHYRTFVFSNFDERLLPILQAWKLDTHLSGILFSTALGASKPDPAAFSAALKAANADAACSLHVGDDPHADGEGAQQSGLAFFQISPPEVDLNTLLRFLGKHPD